ncbi:hypothetical protein ACFQBQ_05040 [Granulicella cerasi]|uniref:Phospholipid/glycerol acyltransferase domain-containing protein n=2 Tax=Granulicella cerasi TaxID=741063 RepID=A0ABW1Z8D3_9BACT
MARDFREGVPVVFFPEGTTGTGEVDLLPFRSGLIAQTIMAKQPIYPGFLHYDLSADDLARGLTTVKDLHWGTQPMGAHLWTLLGIKATHCTIRFASEPIAFTPAGLANRKIAVVEAQAAVQALVMPLQSTPAPASR